MMGGGMEDQEGMDMTGGVNGFGWRVEHYEWW